MYFEIPLLVELGNIELFVLNKKAEHQKIRLDLREHRVVVFSLKQHYFL